MIEKVMNRPKILKIVDTQLIPILNKYHKEENQTLKYCYASNLLEFEDIFEYHYPEDFKDCKEFVQKFNNQS